MLIKHSFLYLLAKGLPGGVNLFALMLFTRLLSPEEYGQYALAIAGVGLANVVIFQWLRLGVLRFYSSNDGRIKVLLATILRGFLVLLTVTAIGGAGGAWSITDPEIQGLFVLSLVVLWSEAFFEINQELARSQLTPIRYGAFALVKSLVTVSLGWAFALAGFGALGLLMGLVAGTLGPIIFEWARIWRGVSLKSADPNLLRDFISYGIPLAVTFGLGFIVSSSDRFIIGLLLKVEDAGLYSAGYDLAQNSLGMIMMIVHLAAYPLAVRALERDGIRAAEGQLRANATLFLLVAIPAAAGFALLSENIGAVLLGKSFSRVAVEIMPWIAFGAFLGGVKSFYFDLSFQLAKHTIAQVWVVLAAALTNVIFNFVLIPIYGLLGAAYSTVISYFVGLALSLAYGRKFFSLPWPWLDAIKICMATIVMVLIILPFKDLRGILPLVTQVCIGIVVYSFLVLVLNVAGSRSQLIICFDRFWRYK